MRRVRRVAVQFAFLALAGCLGPMPGPASKPGAPLNAESSPVALSGQANTRISGQVAGGQLTPPSSASYGAVPAPAIAPVAAASPQGDISLDFADTDIRTVVAQILGTILHQNYTIDPAVQGTATLQTIAPLTRDALIPTLQTLLAQNNAVLIVTNGIYNVVPTSKAAASPGMAATGALGGNVVVPLQYADATQLATVLQPYAGTNGKIVAVPANNTLIVEGDPATRQALIGLIQSFDVDALSGQSYQLFPVTTGDAKDFADAFNAALGTKASGPDKSGPVTVLPLERIDAVLVIARSQSFLADAQRVYAVLNQVQGETIRSWHVYYLQNGRSNDAAYVLQQAFTPDNVTAQPTPQATGQAGAAITSQSSMNGSGSNSSDGSTGTPGSSDSGGLTGSGTSSDTSGQSLSPSGASTTDQSATAGASALLGPLSSSSGGTGTDTDEMRIIPDNANNSLLIYATAIENDRINAMLDKIDISPVEVRIDATIAEVDLNSALQYGTQFFFKSGDINAVLSQGMTSALDTSFPGFVLSGNGSDAAPIAISMLQSVTKVDVLSSPELMVLDGQTASLQVGDEVPYLSQTSQSTETANAPVVNSIEYRDTGVILQVTPHIGSDGMVTLDVSQEVSSVDPTVTTAGIDSPTFSVRTVTSRVAIQDGQTIGLAGLISDSDSRANSGIPYLKNIPLLGALAGSQNNQRERKELLVLITPHVVRTEQDANGLAADMREQMPNAAAVPAYLQSTPVEGSADPSANIRARITQGAPSP